MEGYKPYESQESKKIKLLTNKWPMQEIHAARWWHMLPWEFTELSDEKKALLMASYVVDAEIKNYYESEKSRVMDTKIKNNPQHRR